MIEEWRNGVPWVGMSKWWERTTYIPPWGSWFSHRRASIWSIRSWRSREGGKWRRQSGEWWGVERPCFVLLYKLVRKATLQLWQASINKENHVNFEMHCGVYLSVAATPPTCGSITKHQCGSKAWASWRYKETLLVKWCEKWLLWRWELKAVTQSILRFPPIS